MSTKNKDTWEFANKYCGRLWRFTGRGLLAASVIAMLAVVVRDINYVGIYGSIVQCIQIVFLIIPIIPTELALKKTFDNQGNRRE